MNPQRVQIAQSVRDWALRHYPTHLAVYQSTGATIAWLVSVWAVAKAASRLDTIRQDPDGLTLEDGRTVAVVPTWDDLLRPGRGADVTIATIVDPDGVQWVDLAGWAGPLDWMIADWGDPPMIDLRHLAPVAGLWATPETPPVLQPKPRSAPLPPPSLVIPERRPVDPAGPCPDCGRQLQGGICWGKCVHGWCRACGSSTASPLRSICMPCASAPGAVSDEIWAAIDAQSGWPWHSGATILRMPAAVSVTRSADVARAVVSHM